MSNNILSQQSIQTSIQNKSNVNVSTQAILKQNLSLTNNQYDTTTNENQIKYVFKLPIETNEKRMIQITKKQSQLINLLKIQNKNIRQKNKVIQQQNKFIMGKIQNICLQNKLEYGNSNQKNLQCINQYVKKILRQTIFDKNQFDLKIKDLQTKLQEEIKKNYEEVIKPKEQKKSDKKPNIRYRQKNEDNNNNANIKQINQLKEQIKRLKSSQMQKSSPIFIQNVKKVEVVVQKIIQKPIFIEKIIEVPVEKIIQNYKEKIVEIQNEVLKIIQIPIYIEKIKQIPIQRIIEIEKKVEVPIYIEQKTRVQIPIYIDRKIQVQKIVEKFIEKPVYIDREIEKLVYVDRIIENKNQMKTVYIDRIIEVQKPIFIEKIIEKIVYINPEGKENRRYDQSIKIE